jgi:peptidoglycan hydrolase CwlO-like protein
MFLVDLSYNTVKKEINSLIKTSDMKATALEESKSQLDEDYSKLMSYIEQDEKQTQNEVKKADQKQQERKTLDIKLKGKEQEIVNVKSEIEKNKDSLGSLEQHKRFLL